MITIRDEESLIEYLYLKLIDPGLIESGSIIINPLPEELNSVTDVIINKYPTYDMKLPSYCKVICRIPYSNYEVTEYNKSVPNTYIMPNYILDQVAENVIKESGYYYFPKVNKPVKNSTGFDCYDYLSYQLGQYPSQESKKILVYKLNEYYGLTRTDIARFRKLVSGV